MSVDFQVLLAIWFWATAAAWTILWLRIYKWAAHDARSRSPRRVWGKLSESTAARFDQSDTDAVARTHELLVDSTETERGSALTLGGLALATWGIVVLIDEGAASAAPWVTGQLLLAGAAFTLIGPLLFPLSGTLGAFFGLYTARSLGFGAIVLALVSVMRLAFPSDWRGTAVVVALIAIYTVAQTARIWALWPFIPGYLGNPESRAEHPSEELAQNDTVETEANTAPTNAEAFGNSTRARSSTADVDGALKGRRLCLALLGAAVCLCSIIRRARATTRRKSAS